MLLYYLNETCTGVILLMAVILACAFYAYHVDSRRPDDDPNKKNYHPLAILLAPITGPILFILIVSLFLLRVAMYGIFMVVFILALIFVRKPFILDALRKLATAVGDRLLEANSILIGFFMNPRRGYQQSL
ncbi:MAG TPA: hypothetical protein VGK56_19250 [Anaerolineales bacterium]